MSQAGPGGSGGQPFRLAQGGLIDRGQPVSIRFDGRRFDGYAGDTLASLLLANGQHLLGRSFKYHRPRGLLSAGLDEPNALVELGVGAERTPNTRATLIEAIDGLVASSQNRFPSLTLDLLAVNGWMHRLFVAGFYYKTFMWPARFWEPLYERQIRRAAGLGRAAEAADPGYYQHTHAHVDLLVAGGGVAGLCAALAAGSCGQRVLLVEARPWLGGRIGCESDAIAGDGDGDQTWLQTVLSRLQAMPNVRILSRTTLVSVHEHGVQAAVEETDPAALLADPELPRQRLWVIRSRKLLVASGAWERPLVFAGNDRPGILLASAVRSMLNRHAVLPGAAAVVVTSGDDAYRTAFDLQRVGRPPVAIVDLRASAGAVAERARSAGLRVIEGARPESTRGGRRLRALGIRHADGRAETLACDALAMSAGFNPDVSLSSQLGAPPRWDADRGLFVPPVSDDGSIAAVGAAAGVFGFDAAARSGWEQGLEAAGVCPQTLPQAAAELAGLVLSEAGLCPSATVAEGLWPGRCPGKGKAFVDFQHDVTADDIDLAHREGFVSVEHLKRYTTLGMATDQGRTSSVNGLLLLAAARGQAVETVGTTRFRPPAMPVAVGVYAGHRRQADFLPVRRTALHDWHERRGALFIEAGLWKRASCYPRAGEDIAAATRREALAVRASVGLCDVSTLGKIDVFGPDAAEFLNRIYLNGMLKLPTGKVRYGIMLREDGHVLDDGTAARLSGEHYLVTTTTANAARILAHMEYHMQVAWPELDVAVCSATEQWATMALAGPRSRETLAAALDGVDVSEASLPFMGFIECRPFGFPIRVFRISFSGERAYELSVPWGYAEALWQRLLDAGEPFAITPYGTEALGMLRIEKGHPAGPELDGRTTAIDLGFEQLVAAQKKAYVGQVMARRPGLLDPERPRLVGLRCRDAGLRLRAGAHLLESGAPAGTGHVQGWVSSVTDSPHCGGWIGLGFLSRGEQRHGERVQAVFPLYQEAVEVEVCAPVFVDPEGERLRG